MTNNQKFIHKYEKELINSIKFSQNVEAQILTL